MDATFEYGSFGCTVLLSPQWRWLPFTNSLLCSAEPLLIQLAAVDTVCTAGQMVCTLHMGSRNLCLGSHVHECTMHAATQALLHTSLLAAWRHFDLDLKLWERLHTTAAQFAAACPSRSEYALPRFGEWHFHMRRCGVCR